MIGEIIVRIYNLIAVETMGSPLLFGIFILSFAVILMLLSGFPKWAILSYLTPIILGLSSPFYTPILLPEWVFYLALIFLGILWGLVIIRIKGG